MRKLTVWNIALIVIGLLLLFGALVQLPNSPNVSYTIGTFLPGLILLIFGLKGRMDKKPEENSAVDTQENENR